MIDNILNSDEFLDWLKDKSWTYMFHYPLKLSYTKNVGENFYIKGHDIFYIIKENSAIIKDDLSDKIRSSIYGFKEIVERDLKFEGILDFDNLTLLYPSGIKEKISDTPELKKFIDDIDSGIVKKARALQYRRIFNYYYEVSTPDVESFERLPDGRYKLTLITGEFDSYLMDDVYKTLKGLK